MDPDTKGESNDKQSVKESWENEVNERKCRVAKYEHDRDKLYLCEVAVEFERAMCSHVIPEVFSTGKGTDIVQILIIF